MRRGDVWTAVGGRGYSGKPRPVVIIQDDRFYATNSVTVCAFTTDSTVAPLMRLPVVPDESNGIERPSNLMVDKITTIPRHRLGRRLGQLADQDMGPARALSDGVHGTGLNDCAAADSMPIARPRWSYGVDVLGRAARCMRTSMPTARLWGRGNRMATTGPSLFNV